MILALKHWSVDSKQMSLNMLLNPSMSFLTFCFSSPNLPETVLSVVKSEGTPCCYSIKKHKKKGVVKRRKRSDIFFFNSFHYYIMTPLCNNELLRSISVKYRASFYYSAETQITLQHWLYMSVFRPMFLGPFHDTN